MGGCFLTSAMPSATVSAKRTSKPRTSMAFPKRVRNGLSSSTRSKVFGVGVMVMLRLASSDRFANINKAALPCDCDAGSFGLIAICQDHTGTRAFKQGFCNKKPKSHAFMLPIFLRCSTTIAGPCGNEGITQTVKDGLIKAGAIVSHGHAYQRLRPARIHFNA